MRSRPRKTGRRKSRLALPPIQRSREPSEGRSTRARIKLALAGVLAALVVVNLWVFLWGRRSIPKLRKKATAAVVPRQDVAARPSRGAQVKSLLNLNVPSHLIGGKKTQPAGNEVATGDDPYAEVEARILRGSIGRGDNLYRALKRLGVGRQQADAVVRAMIPLFDFRRARPGQLFTVRISADGERVLDFEFKASPVEIYRLWRKQDRLTGSRVERPVDTRIVATACRIASSLYACVRQVGEDTRLLNLVTGVFAWDINFYTDVRKSDVIKLVVEKDYLDGKFYRYGRLLAAHYEGRAGKYTAIWYQSRKGRADYYDPKGRAVRRTLLKTPLKYVRVSSKFDRKRFHPILHRHKEHLAVDFAAPLGTPVWAAADGEAAFVGRNRAAGNMVVLQHESGMVTVYMHLHRFARGMKKGVRVHQRQVIGYVGSTGRATGSHLHYGLKIDGRYVDPLKVRGVRAPGVRPGQADAFGRVAAALWEEMATLDPGESHVSRLAGPNVLRIVKDLGVRPASRTRAEAPTRPAADPAASARGRSAARRRAAARGRSRRTSARVRPRKSVRGSRRGAMGVAR